MAAITAKEVQALRRRRAPGSWTVEAPWRRPAGTWRRPSGYCASAASSVPQSRQHRERTEGAGRGRRPWRSRAVGAIAMLECETDFVAKSPEFVSLVEELANELALKGEDALAQFSGRIET